MIGIDTYVWNKIIRLQNTEWKELVTNILQEGDFFVTHEVKEEFLHFHPNHSHLLRFVTIVPTLNDRLQYYIELGFDSADASLLEYSELKGYQIMTEDHPMLSLGVFSRKDIFQMSDFFGFLYESGFIASKELYKLTKLLRKWRNITRKKCHYLVYEAKL